ncbi:hypothetical protein GCM10027073_44040 [Streptomyces chlorus]
MLILYKPPGVVDHQHPTRVRGGRLIGPQQLKAPGVDPFGVPRGFGQEELQPLHRRMLGARHRLDPGQDRERLVPLPRGQQPG